MVAGDVDRDHQNGWAILVLSAHDCKDAITTGSKSQAVSAASRKRFSRSGRGVAVGGNSPVASGVLRWLHSTHRTRQTALETPHAPTVTEPLCVSHEHPVTSDRQIRSPQTGN